VGVQQVVPPQFGVELPRLEGQAVGQTQGGDKALLHLDPFSAMQGQDQVGFELGLDGGGQLHLHLLKVQPGGRRLPLLLAGEIGPQEEAVSANGRVEGPRQAGSGGLALPPLGKGRVQVREYAGKGRSNADGAAHGVLLRRGFGAAKCWTRRRGRARRSQHSAKEARKTQPWGGARAG